MLAPRKRPIVPPIETETKCQEKNHCKKSSRIFVFPMFISIQLKIRRNRKNGGREESNVTTIPTDNRDSPTISKLLRTACRLYRWVGSVCIRIRVIRLLSMFSAPKLYNSLFYLCCRGDNSNEIKKRTKCKWNLTWEEKKNGNLEGNRILILKQLESQVVCSFIKNCTTVLLHTVKLKQWKYKIHKCLLICAANDFDFVLIARWQTVARKWIQSPRLHNCCLWKNQVKFI